MINHCSLDLPLTVMTYCILLFLILVFEMMFKFSFTYRVTTTKKADRKGIRSYGYMSIFST